MQDFALECDLLCLIDVQSISPESKKGGSLGNDTPIVTEGILTINITDTEVKTNTQDLRMAHIQIVHAGKPVSVGTISLVSDRPRDSSWDRHALRIYGRSPN
jgi:hypothetical protein